MYSDYPIYSSCQSQQYRRLCVLVPLWFPMVPGGFPCGSMEYHNTEPRYPYSCMGYLLHYYCPMVLLYYGNPRVHHGTPNIPLALWYNCTTELWYCCTTELWYYWTAALNSLLNQYSRSTAIQRYPATLAPPVTLPTALFLYRSCIAVVLFCKRTYVLWF